MIESKEQYESAIQQINLLMSKGSENINKEESLTLKLLAGAAQAYEQTIYKIKSSEAID